MQNQNIIRLDKLTNWLLVFILLIPFLISFGALADLAARNGVSYPWLYPIMIDGGLIIFKAIALRASLRGKRDNYAWGMAITATVISVGLNVVHVPPTLLQLGLARFMSALPPLVILAAFIAVSRRVEEGARMETAVATYESLQQTIHSKRTELDNLLSAKTTELDAIVQNRTAEIERLIAQIERLAVQKSEPQNELRELKIERKPFGTDSIEHARAIRQSKKEQAITVLLDFLTANPNASLGEIADEIERSKSTVVGYINELTQNGRLHKNGHGWEVSG